MTVEELLDKLLNSVERFKQDYPENKRAAIGHLDYIRDRSVALTYLVLAELKDEENNN